MKVVLEAQHACTPDPRGIPVYTIELFKALLRRKTFDYSLTFFDKDKERNNRQYIDKYFGGFDVPKYECNTISYRDLMYTPEQYKNCYYNDMTGTEGDLYHFTHVNPVPSLLKGKMVVTLHDLLPLLFPMYFCDADREAFFNGLNTALDNDAIIIAISDATKKDIIREYGYDADKIHVAYNGYNESIHYPDKDEKFLAEMGITSPYMFYCGAIDMRKNILSTIDAFMMISKDFPELKLVLAGGECPNNAPIKKRLEELKDDRIITMGYISDEQKRKLMSGATAFLFPSFYEGFGLPILEAMACGCPVITSDVSSMPEVAGNAGILINPESTLELAEAMNKVVSSETLRREMIEKGFLQAKKFSWDKTAEEVEEVYGKTY